MFLHLILSAGRLPVISHISTILHAQTGGSLITEVQECAISEIDRFYTVANDVLLQCETFRFSAIREVVHFLGSIK